MSSFFRETVLLSVVAISSMFVSQIFAEDGRIRNDPLEASSMERLRPNESVLMAIASADKRLVAVGEGGVAIFSDDSGATWNKAKVPVSVTLTNIRFVSAKIGWAVGHGGVVLKSVDGGKSWSKKLDGRQAAAIELEAATTMTQSQDHLKNRLIDAKRLVSDGPDKPFLDVYFSSESEGIVVGAYGMIFSTSDGGNTWTSIKERLENPKGKHLYSIQPIRNSLWIAGEQGALYRSTNSGITFSEVKTPYTGTFFGVLSGQSSIVAFGLRGNVFRSTDSGLTWKKIDAGLPITLTTGLLMKNGKIVLADESGRVLVSEDDGASFAPIKLTKSFTFSGVTQSATGDVILAGTRGTANISFKNFVLDYGK